MRDSETFGSPLTLLPIGGFGGKAIGAMFPPRSYAGAPKWQNNGVLFSYLITFSIYQIVGTTSSTSSNEHNSALYAYVNNYLMS